MLNAIQRYVHERRRGLVKTAVLLCGSYAVSSYVNERLEDMKDKMQRTKLARDNLRRRFQSTHDDVCFTIMALIPTLASQVLEDMDVEALTNELQSVSRASRPRALHPSLHQRRSHSVLSSVSDVHSDAGSTSLSSFSGSGFDGDRPSATSGSWVEHMSVSEGSGSRPEVSVQLSDSITSASSSQSHEGPNGPNMENSVASTGSRTRVQLWNEVKILALTRTLTTLYTITLLSLFTTVQLNILGRSRYIDSVRASDRAERARDEVPHFSLGGILAREAISKIVDIEAIWPGWILGKNIDSDEENDEELDAIPEQTEIRFLTLSWWVLHVGWKDVAARVRSSVESVFDEVSLKAKLSPSELFSLIMDVRRRVEMDGTGNRLGARFLSSLLPPTLETTAHALERGGALSIPRESETRDSVDHFLAKSPAPSCDPTHSSSTHGGVGSSIPPLEAPYDGLTRATAIPIESPKPRFATFPTPPSSRVHESDLSSRASQSPSNSFPRLHPAPSVEVSDSLATSRGTLDVGPQFETLLKQTRLYLSGPDFTHALGCALDRATEVLMDGLRARVFVDGASAVNVPSTKEAQDYSKTGDLDVVASEEKRDEIKIRLAGLLPGLARWSQLALNSTPNELVDNIMAVREVNALEAIIISDYEDRFPATS